METRLNAQPTFEAALLAHANEQYETAYHAFMTLALQGHAEAQFAVGTMHENGEHVMDDLHIAQVWYLKAAAQGHTQAQFYAGSLYASGELGAPNLTEALRWYEAAAEAGLADAQNNLAQLHSEGALAQPDWAKAHAWYERAATQGHVGALYNLGILFAEGQFVETSPAQAYLLWEIAANLVAELDQEPHPDLLENLAIVEAMLSQEVILQIEALAEEWTVGDDLPLIVSLTEDDTSEA